MTPILYWQKDNHHYLHKTLQIWADTYKDGILGKERIVVDNAYFKPMETEKKDDTVSRMLWAISDRTGIPAQRFSSLNPAPSFEWFFIFTNKHFTPNDLNRFGISNDYFNEKDFVFSLLDKPSPYNFSSNISISYLCVNGFPDWDAITLHIAKWILNYLNNPKLILWLAKNGGCLHHSFKWLIEQRLMEIDDYEKNNQQDKIEEILGRSPDAIPDNSMKKLWHLFLSNRIKSNNLSIHHWIKKFKRDGMIPARRFELIEILTPRVVLKEPFLWPEELHPIDIERKIKDLVEWEIELSDSLIQSGIKDLENIPIWHDSIAELLPDFISLLNDVLSIMQELEGADQKSDKSYISHPSISSHVQNRNYHTWTILIDLTRDAWLAQLKKDTHQAMLYSEIFYSYKFPLFKRLAFFTLIYDIGIPISKTLDWLLSDNGYWLWTVETEREVLRLLVSLGNRLNESMLSRLENEILKGPMRNMFNDATSDEDFHLIKDREIWLRLAKLSLNVSTLGMHAQNKFIELSRSYPNWKLRKDEKDEFPYWVEGDGDLSRPFIKTPRQRKKLMVWLKENPAKDSWQDDDWAQRCQNEWKTTIFVLYKLSEENIWPVDRWQTAIQTWSNKMVNNANNKCNIKLIWKYTAELFLKIPYSIFGQLVSSISFWLEKTSLIDIIEAELFFEVFNRILTIEHESNEEITDYVYYSMNHPVGHATQALLNILFASEGKFNLPFKQMFSNLGNPEIDKFKSGRVMLASYIISLFFWDEEWVIKTLVPLFNWDRSERIALQVWQGFLWRSRFHIPFIVHIKNDFLRAVEFYNGLSSYSNVYAWFLTLAALDTSGQFSKKELALATRALPQKGLEEALNILINNLQSSGKQKMIYWENRIKPYIKSIWPKSKEFSSPAISLGFSRICVESKNIFPDALFTLKLWLKPLQFPYMVLPGLEKSSICSTFPEDALEFLIRIIDRHSRFISRSLSSCLVQIVASNSDLKSDSRYLKLYELSRIYSE